MKINQFLQYLRYERNLSPLTVKAYGDDLHQLADFLTHGKAEFHHSSVGPSDLRAWMVSLSGQGDGARTVRRKMQAARAFYKWLQKIGEVAQNPAADIELAKLPQRLPQFVREEGLDHMLDAPLPDDATFVEVRNRLIVAILYGTGIRRAELIGLLDLNVDTEQCQMKVHGKRDKDRIVPFGDELKRLIERYRKLRTQVQNAGGGRAAPHREG